jgi:predicted ABC-type transport system involved in lysophospholipase L1 biosynthesis ATPase subunit
MNGIQLINVSFSFPKGRRRIQVLEKFSLDVAEGDVIALLGQSGCGKSTVLSLVAGLRVPDQGTVEVLGVRLAQLDVKARAEFRLTRVAQIYQDFELLPMLTAQENVALLLRLKGEDRSSSRERAKAALEDVGMGHRLQHLPGELSGGERQRVSIARAVVASPSLLLADEPTGSLDADLRDEILDLMLGRLAGTTTVLVTHDPAVAERANRIVRMDRSGLTG